MPERHDTVEILSECSVKECCIEKSKICEVSEN